MIRNRSPIIFLAVLLIFPIAAAAQSDNDTRRESQRLQAENEFLQRELDAARKTIDELEARIETLRTQLDEMRRALPTNRPARPADPPPPRITIDESIPNASPSALVRALIAGYQEDLGDVDRGRAGSSERTSYLRLADRWARRVNRELKAQINWHVKVARWPSAESGVLTQLQAVDPVTEARLGDPFGVRLSRSQLQRLDGLAQRSETGVFLLRGIANPNVVLNRYRESKGPFDKPRLIGPFAEHDLMVSVSNLSAIEEPDEE